MKYSSKQISMCLSVNNHIKVFRLKAEVNVSCSSTIFMYTIHSIPDNNCLERFSNICEFSGEKRTVD